MKEMYSLRGLLAITYLRVLTYFLLTYSYYFSDLPKSTYQSPASVASAIDEMADVIMASATQKAKDAIEEAGQHKVRHWHSK